MFNSSAPYSAFAPHFPSPLPSSYLPVYLAARDEVVPGLSDKTLSIIAPVVTYWAFSLFFTLLDNLNWDCFERHRIHEPEEIKRKNRVSVREVLVAVIVQHVIQMATAYAWFSESDVEVDHAADLNRWGVKVATGVMTVLGPKTGAQVLARYGEQLTSLVYWWAIPALRFAWAAIILDGWQYMMHRTAHQITFLYRTIHSWHHRLYVPYSFGALYNHPIEGFVFDTCGSGIAHMMSGLTLRQATLFFVVSTLKTVDDHCGFAFPYDPLQHLFGNNADYHDIHHQVAGLKKNYSQPWFISWDILFGTRMSREEYEQKVAKRIQRGDVPQSKVNGPNELASTPTSQLHGRAIKEKVNKTE